MPREWLRFGKRTEKEIAGTNNKQAPQKEGPKEARVVPTEERPLTPAERAEHAQRILLAYKKELRRASEVSGALHDAYFNAATTERRNLQDGKITFRKGNFVWESRYIASSQHTELYLTKYPPIEHVMTAEVQEEVGVIISLNHDGSVDHADIRYNHLFIPAARDNNVIQTNTDQAVQQADKFLGDFSTAASVPKLRT
jgi:hypothetical protein